MQKVSRSIFAGLLVIAGLTACGDKVTVAPGGGTTTPATPVVHSVTVQPSSVSLKVGETVKLVATVDADATLARTVTWASGDATKASVGTDGTVTAKAPGTVAITATSVADPTVAGAATIIVQSVTAATISIGSITQGGLPANLGAVAGQLDVTLNVDQGTQTVTELDLIVHSNATNTDTTVAKYMFASPNKAPVSATSAPVTMSFNTAAFNATTGKVAFVNGSYSIKAQAVVAGSTGQSPVSSTMNYTVANNDFMTVSAHGANVATDGTGRQWTGGVVTVTAVPVLYSGRTLLNAIVNAPAAFANTAPETLTTFPDSAMFAVGKDTLTDSTYVAFVNARYSDATQFNGGVAVNSNQIRVDNAAPQKASVFALGSDTTAANSLLVPWVNAVYKFSKGLAKVVDSSTVAGTGLGVGGVTTTFYAIPNDANWKGLGAGGVVGSASGATKCAAPSNAIMVSTGADIAVQSAPGDTTTYRGRAVSADKLGNVVCQDLTYANSAANNVQVFGSDKGAPVNAAFTATSTPAQDINFNSGFNTYTWVLQDSISGFGTPPNIQGTITQNYISTQQPACTFGTWDAVNKVCKVATFTQGIAATGNQNNFAADGYFTVASTVSDLAGNSATVPGQTILVDGTNPAAGTNGSIPNAIGGTSATYTGTVTDNVDLVGSYGFIAYPSYNIGYATSISPSHAAFSGTRDTVGTVTLTVPSDFISSLAVTNATNNPQATALGAGTHPTSVQLWGVDGASNMGGDNIVPTVTDTTGAEVWANTMFGTFAENNAAANLHNGTGTGTRTATLTAQVTGAVAALGVPFTKVCWYYQDASVGPVYLQIGCQTLAVATQTGAGINTWDWTGPVFDPPASLGTAGSVSLIAIGFGHGGSALATQVNTNLALIN